MAASMAIIDMAFMRKMYPNAKLNGVIILATLAVMMLCWVFIRQQSERVLRKYNGIPRKNFFS